jgi:hypothetical protein
VRSRPLPRSNPGCWSSWQAGTIWTVVCASTWFGKRRRTWCGASGWMELACELAGQVEWTNVRSVASRWSRVVDEEMPPSVRIALVDAVLTERDPRPDFMSMPEWERREAMERLDQKRIERAEVAWSLLERQPQLWVSLDGANFYGRACLPRRRHRRARLLRRHCLPRQCEPSDVTFAGDQVRFRPPRRMAMSPSTRPTSTGTPASTGRPPGRRSPDGIYCSAGCRSASSKPTTSNSTPVRWVASGQPGAGMSFCSSIHRTGERLSPWITP